MFFLLLAFCKIHSSFSISSWEINEKRVSPTQYGDMLLTPAQHARYGDGKTEVRGVSRKETDFNRWPDNVVPFILSDRYLPQQKTLLRNALKALEQKTCFSFVERKTERDYLNIIPLDGCYSYVGRIGGRQTLSLAVDCLADYIIWHEVMHALGFEHEHQRPDRDQYIRVEYTNVQPEQMGNFEKLTLDEVDFPDAYDYASIMHYDGMAFGKVVNGRRMATMIPLKKTVHLIDNMDLSHTDLAKLSRLGGCNAEKPCRDTAPNCAQLKQKGLCTQPFYAQTMARQCAQSCNSCGKKLSAPFCEDSSGSCETFAKNGFCTSEYYDESTKLSLCAKSCGLC